MSLSVMTSLALVATVGNAMACSATLIDQTRSSSRLLLKRFDNRAVAFLPACMSTAERISCDEFLRLLYFIANKQASDYFTDLGCETHKEEFCHRRGVYFHKHRCPVGMTCAQAVAIRSAPYVARRHATVPRVLPLRMAFDEWDRDEASERIRA